jgi:hypothetical protein
MPWKQRCARRRKNSRASTIASHRHVWSSRARSNRHYKGDTYCVRIHMALPNGRHIDITRDPAVTGRHEDAHVTIRDAFDAAGRRLLEQARKLAGT